MQPFILHNGVIRFKANRIVQVLSDHGAATGLSLNELIGGDFSQSDWEQFYQLIGYSLSGYHELDKVSDASALEASAKAREEWPDAGGCRDDGCETHSGVMKISSP